jgi:hypothetical protein
MFHLSAQRQSVGRAVRWPIRLPWGSQKMLRHVVTRPLLSGLDNIARYRHVHSSTSITGNVVSVSYICAEDGVIRMYIMHCITAL